MDDVELLVREYVEEVVNAGGCRFMRGEDLEEFVTNLVLSAFDAKEVTDQLRVSIRTRVELQLLPEECRQDVVVDRETALRLRNSLK